MKVWIGYGSEHSYKLVMIGTFSEEGAAEEAVQTIGRLAEAVSDDPAMAEIPDGQRGFTKEMLELLSELKAYSIAPGESEQFAYDYSINRDGKRVEIRTDEIDVMGLIKVLVDKGARVEVYSAHTHPDGASGAS